MHPFARRLRQGVRGGTFAEGTFLQWQLFEAHDRVGGTPGSSVGTTMNGQVTTAQREEPYRRKPTARLRLIAWIAGAAVLVAMAWTLEVQSLLRHSLDWIQGLGRLAPLAFVAVYVLATILFVPGSILTLGAGAAFGVVEGSICVSIGATLGATGAFLIGRYAVRDWVAERVKKNPRFEAVDEAVAREGWKIVGLVRLSPVFPFNFLNYAFGTTGVSLGQYVLASWIGMIPGTVLYVYLGAVGGDLAGGRSRTPTQWAFYAIGLIATIVVTILVTRIARRALEEKVSAKKSPAKASSKTSVPGSASIARPLDRYDKALIANVHPPDWVNPEPSSRYNLVVIGAGTAGLVTAAGAAGLGAKVALIERDLMGGDCLNVGCVPSKALIRASRAYADVRDALDFGVEVPLGARVDFGFVMERMRRLRADISKNDSARRFKSLGVDVFLGEGRFVGPDTVEVASRRLRFRRAVIATGARAASPSIPGLAEAGYVTNETVFSLTELPRRFAVIGAGPIGCEMAQAFARFGSEVTLLEAGSQILVREDQDAAKRVERAMVRDGVRVIRDCKIDRVESRGSDKVIHFSNGEDISALSVDEILVGIGRAPNVERLNLEEVGVEFDAKQGVKVDDRLSTTNARIFAAGDVCSQHKFTHNSDFQARIVLQNALFLGRAKASSLTIPWCTYTDPEIAHVGLQEWQATERGVPVTTFVQELEHVDRALLDGESEGLVKIHVRAGSDQILGATVVARHAGEMLSELTLAMASGLGLGAIAKTVHPYPTQAEAIRKLGDAYNRTRLTPFVKSVFATWLRWTR